MKTVLFHRAEGWYPIRVPTNDDLAHHASLNPGTLRITDHTGLVVLWEPQGERAMRNHVMIDIETLSLQPNALILSIGACVFDEHGSILDTLELFPRFIAGRHIEPATIMWWMQQDEAARAQFNREDRVTRQECHTQLMALIQKAGTELSVGEDNTPISRFTPPPIWAMGPQMDIVVLDNYFVGSGYESLWGYRQIHDARTLRMFYDGVAVRPTVEHGALADAIAQAKWTAGAIQSLKVSA